MTLFDRERRLEAVLDRQQFGREVFDRVLVRAGDVGLGALADVFGLGLGAQPGVVVLLRGEFGLLQQFLEARA